MEKTFEEIVLERLEALEAALKRVEVVEAELAALRSEKERRDEVVRRYVNKGFEAQVVSAQEEGQIA